MTEAVTGQTKHNMLFHRPQFSLKYPNLIICKEKTTYCQKKTGLFKSNLNIKHNVNRKYNKVILVNKKQNNEMRYRERTSSNIYKTDAPDSILLTKKLWI